MGRRFLAILILACAPIPAAFAAGQPSTTRQTSVASTFLEPIPQPQKNRYARLQPKLQSSARGWAQQQASIERAHGAPDVAALESAIQSRFAKSSTAGGADIEALAFIVLMQATNEMDKDLQQTMDEVKKIDEAKQKLRDLLQEAQKEAAANAGKSPAAPCVSPFCQSLQRRANEAVNLATGAGHPIRLDASGRLTYARLKQIEDELNQATSDLNDLSQADQLRLQTEMVRRSNFVQALSNLFKKIEATDDNIVRNLK